MKHVKLFEELNSADQFVTTKLIGNSDVDKYLPIGTILTSFSLEDEKDYSEIPYRAKNQKHYWVTKKKGHSIANQFGLRDDKAQMHIFIGPSLFDDNEIIVCLVDAEENDISMYDESLKTVKGAIRRFADDVGLTKLTQESTMIKNYEDFLNEAKKTEKFIDNIFLKKVKAKFDSLTKGMKEGDAAVSSGISGDMLFLEWCPDMASDYENQEAYRAAGCTAFNDPNQPYDDLELNYYQFVPKIIESLGGRLVVKLDGKLQDSKKGKPILFGTH